VQTGNPRALSGSRLPVPARRTRPPMDARAYFQLTDAIASADTADALAALADRIRGTEMHPLERRVIERVLRTRADTLRLAEVVVPRPPTQRAD
jgi:hypothetical protein